MFFLLKENIRFAMSQTLNLFKMEKQNNSKYWTWFFIWLVVLIVMFIFIRQYVWLALPGTVTYFAKAMNLLDPNRPEDLEW